MTAALVTVLGGCQHAPSSTTSASRPPDCPPGRALICTQKMGKQEDCTCETRSTLEDVIDPEDY